MTGTQAIGRHLPPEIARLLVGGVDLVVDDLTLEQAKRIIVATARELARLSAPPAVTDAMARSALRVFLERQRSPSIGSSWEGDMRAAIEAALAERP